MANQGTVTFKENTRAQAKASIVIEGLSGSGKSGLALLLATILAGSEESVYAIDTENKSLGLYDGLQMSTGVKMGKFKKFDLQPTLGFKPSIYLEARDIAKANGAKAFVSDSITHMWQREGGILEMVSNIEKAATNWRKGWSAWGEPEVIREKNAIFNIIRDSDVHCIATVRVKEKFEQTSDTTGKTIIKSLGEQQQQMPDLKYEADLVLHMVEPGNSAGKPPVARVIKTRYAILEKDVEYQFTEKLMKQIRDYLNEGVDAELLKEEQRKDLIATILHIVATDVSKKTMLPVLLDQIGRKGSTVEELPLDSLRILLGTLIN